MRSVAAVLCLCALLPVGAGCTKYVPANLPLRLEAERGDGAEPVVYRDALGRELGSADADGPELRFTMRDGRQFFMKAPFIRGDSVVGFYRPTSDARWAPASVELYDVLAVERRQVDWLATTSLLITPITLALLLTY